MTKCKRIYALQGLDNFTAEENASFWRRVEAMKQEGEGVALRNLGLSTTDACNFNCIYCYGTEAANRDSRCGPLRLEEQIGLIDQGIELGIRQVTICGNGEPTYDRDLLQIVAHAGRKGLYTVILTNGFTLGDDTMARRIYGRSAFDVAQALFDANASLIIKTESINRSLYNEIVAARGIEDPFHGFSEAIENVVKIGFTNPANAAPVSDDTIPTRLCISSVICKRNFFEIPGIREWAHDLGAQFVCKLPTLSGNSKENLAEFFEVNPTTAWLKEHYGYRHSEKPETLSTDEHHCGAFHFGVVIGNTGDIRHCYPMAAHGEEAVGNIRNKPLRELLLERSRKFGTQLSYGAKCQVKKSEYIPILEMGSIGTKGA
ncbi:radical SAM protein [Sulfuricella sp.]|uniref:radical SAM protein n=1 Tax=Sulfuricella sp. TaxID=2099377 RepID=UPI002C0BB929|nr:radical SAM protein [Sulfuricella sp.]HUX62676.1 radical SAM protein [Sulfuricella sp.]